MLKLRNLALFTAGFAAAIAGVASINACTVDEVPPAVEEPATDDYTETVKMFTSDGLTPGDVIICEPGLEVSTDTTPGGTTWAACM